MVSEKKIRKNSAPSVPASPPKLSKDEVYNNAISFEEKEVGEFNRQAFHDCFAQLKKLIEEVSELKEDKSEEAKSQIIEKRIQGSLIVVKLKKLNRLDKILLRSGRDSLQKEKLQVDSNRLRLQNLIYEAAHLKKEIQKCYQFKSEDEDIQLISLEEFQEKAPETLNTPEVSNDDHALRLARLEFELQQRREYDKLCKELQQDKEKVAKDIISEKEKLESLDPRLQEVRKATRPIQEILGMPFEKEWEIQRLARLLPPPLYMAYSKLSAYSEVIDKYLSCSIEGDEDEAKQLEVDRKQAKLNKEVQVEEEDSENDNDDNDFDESENRHKQRRQSRAILLNQKREKLFKHHPLSINFNINTKNREETLSITLIYLPALGFVTVQCKFSFDHSQSIAAGDIITQDRILNSLYVDDYGNDSPNPKTAFQLNNLQLDVKNLTQLLDDKKLGKPYKWAQRLCGLNFLAKLNNDECYDLCEETVPKLIRQMRKRLNARMKLYYQIQTLEIGKLSTTSTVKTSSILQQFVALSFSEYAAISCTRKFVDHQIVNSNDLYYRAIVTRGSAKLECYIAVPGDFPTDLPLFAILLSWNDEKYHSENNSHLREIEHWINSMQAEKSIDNILPLQLQRAMSSMDIFLETENTQHEVLEFQQEKNYFRNFRGRMRNRPYKLKTIGPNTYYKQV
ncbi:unnamed protein product [Diamesa hyperborea]